MLIRTVYTHVRIMEFKRKISENIITNKRALYVAREPVNIKVMNINR